MAFLVQKTDFNSTLWGDPATPDVLVRLKQTQAPKSMTGGVDAINHRTEFVLNDRHGVMIDGIDTHDKLSVRLSVSGTAESESRLVELVDMLTNTVSVVWNGTHWTIGYTPFAPPAFPAP